MRDDAELSSYEIAFMSDGPERVAMVVLVALHEDEQIKISPARHRIDVVRRAPRNLIETAALEAIPRAGKVLGPAVLAIADSAAVQDIGRRLRSDRLLAASRISVLWRWGRSRAIHRLLRRLIHDPATDGLTRVAAMGTPGIADPGLRRIFETPDPPPPVKMPKMPMASTDSPYSPPDRIDLGGA
jgi:hypothetical protein